MYWRTSSRKWNAAVSPARCRGLTRTWPQPSACSAATRASGWAATRAMQFRSIRISRINKDPAMSAISLYAKPSPNFAQKLEASKSLLQSAAAQYAPLTQASSLGAEDMVISHLIVETGIASSIFVLDTRMLHAQTLALVGRLEAHYGVKVDVYQPDPEAAEKFVAEFGDDARYKNLALRKACCHLRKMEPLERAPAGKNGRITGPPP